MIELRVRSRIDTVINPIGRFLAKIGVRPIPVTLVGLAITLTGSTVLALGSLVLGPILILVGSALDGLDGAVARASGTASKRGALIDSVSDRIGETSMFAACAFWLTSRVSPAEGDPALVVLTLLSLGAAMLTSYLRAKADVEGVDGRGGMLGRAERIILFTSGFLFGFVPQMLLIMATLTWITVFQRFWKTWQLLGGE